MNNLYIKPPGEYSKREKIILYTTAVLIIAFFVFINYYQTSKNEKTIRNGKKLKTRIIDVGCTTGKGKSRLYFRDEHNQIKHVNVTYLQCKEFRDGDTISIFVNVMDDWYEIDPASLMQRETTY